MKTKVLITGLVFACAAAFAADADGHLGDYDRKHRIDVPVKRNDGHTEHYLNRHNSRISRIRKNESKHYDIVFVGDSITHNWERDREKRAVYGQQIWGEEFADMSVLNCGFGGDRVETAHWRMANGELDGYKADNFCVLIGTNNRQNTSEEISQGIKSLVKTIEEKHPESRIVLMTILPRNDIHPPKVTEEIIARVRGANPLIEAWARDDAQIVVLNLDPFFLNEDGSVKSELFNDGIHPNPAGYRIWARELKKVLKARGGYTVDFEWKDGKVSNYKVSGGMAGGYEVNGDGVKAETPSTIATVEIASTLDGNKQRCKWRAPKGGGARPLLVNLHTWSKDWRSNQPIAEKWCEDKDWAYIAPDFRGPNKRPKALGSEFAVQDIVDAVNWAKANANIDDCRVYLMGGSGGGHMTLLMAGRHPELWTAVAAFCPITDVGKWYEFHSTKAKDASGKPAPDRYAQMMSAACGEYPNDEYAKRSPVTYLSKAKGIKAYIATGIHDGHKGSVPVGHAIRGFNCLAGEEDRIPEEAIEEIERTRKVPDAYAFSSADPDYPVPIYLRRRSGNVQLTLFEGAHNILPAQGLHWLENQMRGQPVVWDLPPMEGDYSLTLAPLTK